jgi:hypothetical protein
VIAWYDNDANTLNIQIDNGTVHTASAPAGGGAPDGTHNFNLGSSGSGSYMPGRIDATGIWKRVLTSDERAYLWNNGTGREIA